MEPLRPPQNIATVKGSDPIKEFEFRGSDRGSAQCRPCQGPIPLTKMPNDGLFLALERDPHRVLFHF